MGGHLQITDDLGREMEGEGKGRRSSEPCYSLQLHPLTKFRRLVAIGALLEQVKIRRAST
jgi:hypothetical protein